MMKAPTCKRCRGVFSRRMYIEKFDDEEYHPYCAEAEQRERRKKDPLQRGIRLSSFWLFPFAFWHI